MTPNPYSRHTTNSPDMESLQDRITEFTSQLDACPFLLGRHIKGVVVATSPAETRLEHKLGRMPEGWIITRKRAIEHVVESPTTDPTSKYLHLTASWTCTVDIWVF